MKQNVGIVRRSVQVFSNLRSAAPRQRPWLGALVLSFSLTAVSTEAADFLEQLGTARKKLAGTNAPPTAALAALSQDQVVGGLKEALGKGVQQAIANLGKDGGFLNDINVKIPLPESLRKVEKTLRTLRQEKLADEFITTMNRAAEQAVPEAAAVLGDSVKQMTLTDAKAILAGTNNAATTFFRRTSETNLHARFLPIVKKATESAGVTAAYKQMMDRVGKAGSLGSLNLLGGSSLLGKEALDVDGYVTHKALDGLFLKIAEEEKRIRENPLARNSDLLKKVFSAVQK